MTILAFLARLAARVKRRPPDLIICGRAKPYLLRWYAIPRNPVFNIYLHEFRRSDDERALHDHPWANLSIVIEGQYVEHTIKAGGVNARKRRKAGAVKFRWPWGAHRIELIDERPCTTFFLTGPKCREWGFLCPDAGWVHWRDFTAGERGEIVGKGCGDDTGLVNEDR